MYGLKFIESMHCVKYRSEPRTWKERLFSWPWRPWIKDKSVPYPSPDLYQNGDTFIGHPATIRKIKENLQKQIEEYREQELQREIRGQSTEIPKGILRALPGGKKT